MTFQVGDKVIYPNHGLGVVQGIETKTILGTTCGFYHLRMVANETTVLVPVDNVDGVGLRRAIGDEEIERLFIAETLQQTGGNREAAAEMLGIGQRTLYRKIKQFRDT